jgi:hypothetical protein
MKNFLAVLLLALCAVLAFGYISAATQESPTPTPTATQQERSPPTQGGGKTLEEVLKEIRSKDPSRKKINDPKDIIIDVVTRQFDILHFTVDWPKTITATNVSALPVNYFRVNFSADKDEGGLTSSAAWGCTSVKNDTPPLKPGEKITVPIPQSEVNVLQENGRNFIYMQLVEAYANNDLTTKYSYGAVLKQDPTNPRNYRVVVDSKGRKIGADGQIIEEAGPPHQHNRNHAIFLHITHSVKPPAGMLGCCTRQLNSEDVVSCPVSGDCVPPPFNVCTLARHVYTVCSVCCSAQTAVHYESCSVECEAGRRSCD